MYEKVIVLEGNKPGPTSMILVGVHGNEICGISAIKKILPTLKIDSGKLFIAYGNPKAIRKNVRYTESNLNRMFKPNSTYSKKVKYNYEFNRAQFLKKYLNKSDVLLDIHASFTPKSKKFVICENNAYQIAKYLPFDTIVSGFDYVQPGGTDYYMNRIGKIGICIECGYLKDKNAESVAFKSIYSFLSIVGNINDMNKIYKKSCINIYNQYLAITDDLRLSKKFRDFEKIKTNQVIGIDGKNKIVALKKSIILFATDTKKIGDESFLLGEYKKV